MDLLADRGGGVGTPRREARLSWHGQAPPLAANGGGDRGGGHGGVRPPSFLWSPAHRRRLQVYPDGRAAGRISRGRWRHGGACRPPPAAVGWLSGWLLTLAVGPVGAVAWAATISGGTCSGSTPAGREAVRAGRTDGRAGGRAAAGSSSGWAIRPGGFTLRGSKRDRIGAWVKAESVTRSPRLRKQRVAVHIRWRPAAVGGGSSRHQWGQPEPAVGGAGSRPRQQERRQHTAAAAAAAPSRGTGSARPAASPVQQVRPPPAAVSSGSSSRPGGQR